MKTIKFRCYNDFSWVKEGLKEMVYIDEKADAECYVDSKFYDSPDICLVYGLAMRDGRLMGYFAGDYMTPDGEELLNCYEEDLELMMFTGFKDKFNTDIYEDDVIQLESENRYLISFADDLGAFIGTNVDTKEIAYMPALIGGRIIGNIHEQPTTGYPLETN